MFGGFDNLMGGMQNMMGDMQNQMGNMMGGNMFGGNENNEKEEKIVITKKLNNPEIPKIPENFKAFTHFKSMGFSFSGDYYRCYQYLVDKVISKNPFPATVISYFKCGHKITLETKEKEKLDQEMYSMQIPALSTYQGNCTLGGKDCQYWKLNMDWFGMTKIDMSFFVWNDTTQGSYVIKRFNVDMDMMGMPMTVQMDFDNLKIMDFSEKDVEEIFCVPKSIKGPHTLEEIQKCDTEIFPPIKEKYCTFVLDQSGSMDATQKTKTGKKSRIAVLKERMQKLLKDLNSSQSFNIIAYASKVNLWKKQPVKATEENVEDALKFIQNMKASGSTNSYDALKFAINQNDVEAVYFLSDGIPNKQPSTILDMVEKEEKKLKHPVKIHATNFFEKEKAIKFLQQLSKLTAGVFTNIQDGQI